MIYFWVSSLRMCTCRSDAQLLYLVTLKFMEKETVRALHDESNHHRDAL